MLDRNYKNILYIDLKSKEYYVKQREDLWQWLGGVGLASKILDEEMCYDKDALDQVQPLVLAVGPLNTVYPGVTKAVAMFKSPHTGELGESYAGLRIAMAMVYSSIDAIVIKGKSEHPCYLSIDSKGVKFNNAKPIWGTDTEKATALIRERENGRGFRSILAIGPAGESLVTYSCVVVDSYRHFGRLGMGAVMGSKNLKAIVVKGDNSKEIENLKEYKQVYQNIYSKFTDTEIMDKYHGLGTSGNILVLNEMMGLPTKNLQKSIMDSAYNISGEAFCENNLIRKLACAGCPIGCIHIAINRKQFSGPQEYYCSQISYDHELLFSLGSFLGIDDRNEILDLIEQVELMGLDAISTGVILGWMTEAYEKGIINKQQLLKDIDFGDGQGYRSIINNIVKAPNGFYRSAGKGLYFLSNIYGGQDFAMTLGRNEIAGYHTGYGCILGQEMGARHSHLDNGGYSIDQTTDKYNKETLISKIMEEEKIRNVLNCLCACLFTRNIYSYDTIVEALGALGIEYSKAQLIEAGDKIFKLKQNIKHKMGYRPEKISVPERFFSTKCFSGKLDIDVYNEAKQSFIKEISNINENYTICKHYEN